MRKLTVEELCRMDVTAFRAAEKLPLVVVLDNVRSLHNVGSVFRTADAFRLAGVWLCGITACPPSAEIHKTALGAEDSVSWTYCDDTLQAVERLRAEGYIVLAVEQVEGSLKLDTFRLDPSRRYALVMGNEVRGVRQDVVDATDQALEIPQYGTKHSMNVSVTAGIVMWEFARQLRR
ncbi:tRNA (guanosine(18)-2'-O)-methyltransferase [Bacteroidaceae bacterium]|uniref:RNA methyltransferase n=1 Tax=Prevotella sp. MGM2 TaxID=2033406 RepID=UPI000CE9CF09|nr:RNA methyltransferase [Prevotella sp. MGM2]GFI35505.1 tRNA (guanosine(18)-2'-O)-methyltransferase [Bacteroidaceae bacterium]